MKYRKLRWFHDLQNIDKHGFYVCGIVVGEQDQVAIATLQPVPSMEMPFGLGMPDLLAIIQNDIEELLPSDTGYSVVERLDELNGPKNFNYGPLEESDQSIEEVLGEKPLQLSRIATKV